MYSFSSVYTLYLFFIVILSNSICSESIAIKKQIKHTCTYVFKYILLLFLISRLTGKWHGRPWTYGWCHMQRRLRHPAVAWSFRVRLMPRPATHPPDEVLVAREPRHPYVKSRHTNLSAGAFWSQSSTRSTVRQPFWVYQRATRVSWAGHRSDPVIQTARKDGRDTNLDISTRRISFSSW